MIFEHVQPPKVPIVWNKDSRIIFASNRNPILEIQRKKEVAPQNSAAKARTVKFVVVIVSFFLFLFSYIYIVSLWESVFSTVSLFVGTHIFINKIQYVKMAYLLCRYLKHNRIHKRTTIREKEEKKSRTNILTSSGQEILVLTNVSEEKDV